MDWEQYQKHKPYAGEKKPSMLRRRIGHDYESRCMYMITMTVEGRRPLLGRLVGKADAPTGSIDEPRVELTLLGEKVRECWMNIEQYHPQIQAVRLQIMPDHLHGILFVKEKMDYHLGQVINGFKVGCNKAYRELGFAVPSAADNAAAKTTGRQHTNAAAKTTGRQHTNAAAKPTGRQHTNAAAKPTGRHAEEYEPPVVHGFQ